MWEGEERREFSRVDFPCKILASSPVRLITTHTENISEGGIQIIIEEKLTPYSIVGLELFFEKDKPIKGKGKVAWVREKINPLGNEAILYDTGIKFIDLSTKDKNYIRVLVQTIEEKRQDF